MPRLVLGGKAPTGPAPLHPAGEHTPLPRAPQWPQQVGSWKGTHQNVYPAHPNTPRASRRQWLSPMGQPAWLQHLLLPTTRPWAGGVGGRDGTDYMDKLAADQGLCRVPSPCWLWWPRGQPLLPKPCGPGSPFWGERQVDNTQPYNLGGGAWGSDLQLGGHSPGRGHPYSLEGSGA